MGATVVQQERSLKFIPVGAIRESAEALRTVDRKNAEYIQLADSVRQNGILNPICVREMQDAETNEAYYSLIEGCQRWNAAKDAGLQVVPAQIMSSGDFDVLLQQIIGNTARVETLPAEHSKQLQRILQMNPTMTVSELASKCSRGEAWIKERLRLTNLTPEVAKLVDSGAINLTNSYILAKLPQDEQAAYMEQAQSMPYADFTNMVKARLDAINKAKRAGGTSDVAPEFVHKPYLRKISDVASESESGAVAAATIAELRITSPEEAWKQALLWALTTDTKSVATAKAKWDENEKVRQEKKAQAALERERRKAGVAGIKHRRAQLEMQLSEAGASAEDKAAQLKAFDDAPENKMTTKVEETTVAS